MRTATILAKTHKGKWELLATPDESLIEQAKKFRTLRAERANADFATVISQVLARIKTRVGEEYQESDGEAQVARFLTPEQFTAAEKTRAADQAEHQKFQESIAKGPTNTANTERGRLEREFKAREQEAAAIENRAKEKGITVAEAAEQLALETPAKPHKAHKK